jgi:hypothetical protein
MTNPILIHAEQAKGKAFGDPRLVKRGRNCMKQSEQQFQIQNVAKDTKSLKCLRSRGLMPIFRINVMLYLVIDQVCLQVTDSLRDRNSRRECKKTQRLGQYLLYP